MGVLVIVRGVAAVVVALAVVANLDNNKAAPVCLGAAAVYKVGDKAGWTTIGNVDYKQWSALNTFQLGDVIRFEYNAEFHNVMQVTHDDYKACNSSKPKATYSSGNDSITITTRGHHFFFCGVPGHCQAGQKVDINVPRLHPPAAAAASSPTTAILAHAPPPQTTTTTSSSSSSTSSAVPAIGVSGPSPNQGVSLTTQQLRLAFSFAAALTAFAVYT